MRFLIKYTDILRYREKEKNFKIFEELKSEINNIYVLMDEQKYDLFESINLWRKEVNHSKRKLEAIGFPYHYVILQRDRMEEHISKNHIDYVLSFDNEILSTVLDEYVEFISLNQESKDLERNLKKIIEHNFSPIMEKDTAITDSPSKDKIWLKNYNKRAGKDLERFGKEKKSIFRHICDNNRDFLYEVAIDYYGVEITYDELIKNVDTNAKVLTWLGVEKNDVITICSPNVPSSIYFYFAAQEIGAVPSMMHVYSSPEEMKRYLTVEKSKIVIMIGMNQPKRNLQSILDDTSVKKVVVIPLNDSLDCSCMESMKTKLGIGFLGTKVGSRLLKNEGARFDMPSDERFITHKECICQSKNQEVIKSYTEISTIIHTGGTTGMGKSTLLTHENINRNDDAFEATIQDFERGDAIITIPPLFHILGLNNCIILILRAGGKVVLVSKYRKKELPKLIQKHHPAFLFGVPKIGRDILEVKEFAHTDLSSLKYYVLGGEEMSLKFLDKTMDFLKEHNARIKVSQSLGATEGSCSLTNTFEPNIIGSLGIPLINMDMKIVRDGENGTVSECTYGECGEICFSGPSIMQGYLNDEEENALTLRKHDDGKVWLHTGDLGYVNQEGVLFFVDRIKDMLKINGEQVYPSKIKKVIMQHQAVRDCAVVGTEDAGGHKRVAAIITLHNPLSDIEQIKQEIMTLCTNHLTRESIPYYIEVQEQLPETKLFKVDNCRIQKKLQQMKETSLVIGVDADGVLTDMWEFNRAKGEEFFRKQPVNECAYDICSMFGCDKHKEFLFGLKYFVDYSKNCPPRQDAVEVIQKLNSEGNELHEITARKFVTNANRTGRYSRSLFENWLKKHGMEFCSIQYCSEKFSPRDKFLACHKLKVDVMIEDKEEVALYLAEKGIQVLLFDAPYNKNVQHRNIRRVENWEEIYNILETYRQKKESFPPFEQFEGMDVRTLSKEERVLYLNSNRDILRETVVKRKDTKKELEKTKKRFHLLYQLGRLPLWFCFHPVLEGRENVPYQDGMLIVSNHLDNYDQFLIARAFNGKAFTGMAASTIKNTLRGKMFAWLGVTFVDRDSSKSRKMAQKDMEVKLLSDANCLIFPEGTRKNRYAEYKNVALLEFKYGAVAIAQRTGAPIIPIAIQYGKWFGKRTVVRIGEPMVVEYEEDLAEKNEALRDCVMGLMGITED